jgi:ubiquinone/menaquinone biosynthesis C-methylase UbiE
MIGTREDPQHRPAPPPLLGHLFEQFGRPSGVLGRVAGWLMARTDADDRWVVDLLDVEPTDRVLDVGCGPGVTIRLLAERATAGFVAGVDPSEVMVRQATARNRAAVAQGRVELRRAGVSELPYPDGHFTKACAVHSLYFWPSLEQGLRELRRVLVPDGRLVLAVRMRHPKASRFDPSRYGLTDADIEAIVGTLLSLGFQEVTTRTQPGLDRQTMAAVIGRR